MGTDSICRAITTRAASKCRCKYLPSAKLFYSENFQFHCRSKGSKTKLAFTHVKDTENITVLPFSFYIV